MKLRLLLGVVTCAAILNLQAADTAAGGTGTVPAFKVEKHGHGSPVILIPGLGCSGAVWEGTVAALEDKHECYVLTLAGFGGQAPIQTPLIETASKELVAYIKEHKLKQPVVIGHSLGGVMALYLAANHPKEIGPIVIVDSLPALGYARPDAKPEEVKAMADGIGKQMEEAPRADFDANTRQFLKAMINGEEGQKKAGDWMAASDQKTVGHCFQWIFMTDLRPELPKISSRALLVAAGAEPGAVPEEVCKAQYEGLKGIKIVRDPKAHHFIMLDDPEFLNKQIKGFLDSEK